MKSAHGFLLCALAFACVLGSLPADAPKPRNASFGTIDAKEIVLTSGDGRASITLKAMANQVGIWVGSNSSDKPRQVAIVAGDGVAYLGFNHERMFKAPGGCPLAFSLEDDGTPTMQTVKGDKVRFQGLADLPK